MKPALKIAHRGGSGLMPENTLAAFNDAVLRGYDGAELDVQLTADGQVVVFHDRRLHRAFCRHADGPWIEESDRLGISRTSYSRLMEYTIGEADPATEYAHARPHLKQIPGQRIPLLAEVIRSIQEVSDSFRLVIEIKSDLAAARDQPWRELLESVIAIVNTAGFAQRTVFCAFDWGALVAARESLPGVPLWFTTQSLKNEPYFKTMTALGSDGSLPWLPSIIDRNFAGNIAAWIHGLGGAAWFMHHSDCNPATVKHCQDAGIQSAVWSVNLVDRAEIDRIEATEADIICSDYP